MPRISKTLRPRTLTLATIAGIASSAPAVLAQARQGNERPQAQQQRERIMVFQSADELIDEALMNAQGEKLGTIEDIVIDRGTGKIHTIVIEEGGFLGIGDTHVAVPYMAFSIDTSTRTLRLNVSQDMISDDEGPALPDGWHRLEDDWDESLDQIAGLARASQTLPDVDKDAETKTLQGTITDVKRVDLGEGRHWLAVRVNEQDASQERTNQRASADGQWVVLGPAWFAVSNAGTPVRGEPIEVEAFEGFGDMMHAKQASFGGQQVEYRDDELKPAWTDRDMRSGTSSNGPGPMVLLSDVLEREVVWNRSGEEIGEVEDAVLELTGGYVAILAVEPEDDWWGGDDDEDRAVPFDVARIGHEHIALDATRTMLSNAPKMPEDASAIMTPQNRQAVFVVFEVSEPMYVMVR